MLRIYTSLRDRTRHVAWARAGAAGPSASGECALQEVPYGGGPVEIVLPAHEVLLLRAKLPPGTGRLASQALSYAIEDETVGDADAEMVVRVARIGSDDILAVMDRAGWMSLRDALVAAGMVDFEVHTTSLMLPLHPGQWSLLWNGRDGCIRTAEFEATASDTGSDSDPPLSLRLQMTQARAGNAAPSAIAVYVTSSQVNIDAESWARTLGVPVRMAGPWDWRAASTSATPALLREQSLMRMSPSAAQRLRWGVIIGTGALLLHLGASLVDWAVLAGEQSDLRSQMEARFRRAVPDAVAVADPALQMRRKLAEARHAMGQPDAGDFLSLIEPISAGLSDLPANSVRQVTYDEERVSMQVAVADPVVMQRLLARLRQSGLVVDVVTAAPGNTGGLSTIKVGAL